MSLKLRSEIEFSYFIVRNCEYSAKLLSLNFLSMPSQEKLCVIYATRSICYAIDIVNEGVTKLQ